MRIFASKRIAYLEDLDNDPDVLKMYDYQSWILVKKEAATEWEPKICEIKGIDPKGGFKVTNSGSVESYSDGRITIALNPNHNHPITPVITPKFFYYNNDLDYLVGFTDYQMRGKSHRSIADENIKSILQWIEDNSQRRGAFNAIELGLAQ